MTIVIPGKDDAVDDNIKKSSVSLKLFIIN